MLKNIKSNYILKIIFKNNLSDNQFMNLIKYNKKLQKRLNISINDFKTFKKIEIEVTPIEELEIGEKYTFINFNEKNKSFYHIYFDNNKDEINRTYITKEDNIKKIKIIIDEEINSLSAIFKSCYCLRKINFTKFNRYDITKMNEMFGECDELNYLNINKLKTDKVTTMSHMFNGCYSLKKLNISKFNTSNVIDMRYMFSGCSSLEELNLSNFDTSNVENMSYMFSVCDSLKVLNISNFNTSKVLFMNFMFFGCHSLLDLDITHFNFIKIRNLYNMFAGCPEKIIDKIEVFNANLLKLGIE